MATQAQADGPCLEEAEDLPGGLTGSGGASWESTGSVAEVKENVPLPYPSLAPVVFFWFHQSTRPRSWCLALVSTWFERVSMLVILLNCVTLGMFQPCQDLECNTDRCSILQAFDDFIFAFFAVEMVVKMVALGIFGPKCYLGDTWNRLDLFIVMAGMLEYSLDGHNVSFSAIRIVRVLRPLRAINRVPSMRILVTLLLDTLPMLGNVLLLCFFVFFIFGIVGVQLWAGLLRNRCFFDNSVRIEYYRLDEADDIPFICSTTRENGMLHCSNIPKRRVGRADCELTAYNVTDLIFKDPPHHGCVNWNLYYNNCSASEHNPHNGAINFDNIGYAWIAIFQVITLEGWVDIMYYVMDAHSFYNFIYFIFLIIVGSFFMINLCLVVIATQFSETKQRENQLMQEQRARFRSNESTLASLTEPGSCYEEMLKYLVHVCRKLCRHAARLYGELCHKRHSGVANPSSSLSVGGTNDYRSDNGTKMGPTQYCMLHYHHPLQHQHYISNGIEMKTLHLNRDAQSSKKTPSLPLALQNLKGLRLGMNYPTILPSKLYTNPHTRSHSTGGSSSCPICALEGDGVNCTSNTESDREKQGPDVSSEQSKRNQDLEEKGSGHENCVCMCVHYARAILRRIVDSKYFNRGIMIAILINTLSMGVEYHEQPEELTDVLEISNIVFTSLFALEMLLKLLACGLFNYISNLYNIFDGIIVTISVCEIVGQADGGFSVLRTFRLLRVLKLVRFLPALRRQLVVLMKTMDNVATFCMLLMLFIFIFSILGMHLFGCKFTLRLENGDTVSDRKNFDSLLWAIVTVFQILTQEDWNVVLYNGMASTSPWAALYFVALMTFGNYVLFNLLVAILVEGFQAEGDASRSDTDDMSSDYGDEDKLRELLNSGVCVCVCVCVSVCAFVCGQLFYSSLWGSRRSSWNSLGHTPSLMRRAQSGERESLLSGAGQGSMDDSQSEDGKSRTGSLGGVSCLGSFDFPELLQVPRPYLECNGRLDGGYPSSPNITRADPPSTQGSWCLIVKRLLEPYKPQWCRDHEDWSLYLFSPQNKFRMHCQKVITHKMFDHIVLFFIFLNCITIALERPDIQADSMERIFLKVSNYIFTVIFMAEMTMKVVSFGLYAGPGSYLKSSWNVLDGLLVFVSIVDILVSLASSGGNRILGILRALMSLFVLSSKDGWVNIMYDGLDAVAVDQQPIRNHNPWMLLYFISFLLIVSFFVLNMFVGVVVENFHKCRQDQEEEEARQREEKRQKRMEKRRRSECQIKPYYADYSPTRLYIHTFCTSHYLDLFITIIIAINVLTMSMEHYRQPKYLDEGLKYCNYFFTLVFVIEAVLKLVAFGFRRFFKERWNQLDLAIVLLSIMGITLEEIDLNASLPINPTIIRIMRVLRIARVLKLLKMATGMRALLDTVVQALPQVGNLGLLFMLLFFIYAALGVELFGKLECTEENPCEGLSRHATFQNFGMAFLTLFRVSTGDNWNGIMKDTLRECKNDKCLSYLPLLSPLYFVTFVLIAQFVLVNVVVAVLMKHLEDSNKDAREEAEMEAELKKELHGSRRQSTASVGGAPGRPSISRVLSLPNDSYMLYPVKPVYRSIQERFSKQDSTLPGDKTKPIFTGHGTRHSKLSYNESFLNVCIYICFYLQQAIKSDSTDSTNTDSRETLHIPSKPCSIDNLHLNVPSIPLTGGSAPCSPQASPPPPLRNRTASVQTSRPVYSQRSIPCRQAAYKTRASQRVARSHNLSSYEPLHSGAARQPDTSAQSLRKYNSMENNGFLSQLHIPRRHSTHGEELLLQQKPISPSPGPSPMPKKEKMSPPCISIDPPTDAEFLSPAVSQEHSTVLRRRTPSFDSALPRESIELPDMQDEPLLPSHLPLPQFFFDQSDVCSLSSLSKLLSDSDQSTHSFPPEARSRVMGDAAQTPLRKKVLVRMASTRDPGNEDSFA
uniref:Voltage-dependent T-type calcium channel subunit alpha n=1 Tax=Sinocyclocheilus grahami TaxID=75366 RepID=A0A672MDK4_SINGR